MDDCQLVNTSAESPKSEMVYGSEEDESDALAFLSAVNKHDTELIETVMCHFKEKFENLPEVWIYLSLVFFIYLYRSNNIIDNLLSLPVIFRSLMG